MQYFAYIISFFYFLPMLYFFWSQLIFPFGSSALMLATILKKGGSPSLRRLFIITPSFSTNFFICDKVDTLPPQKPNCPYLVATSSHLLSRLSFIIL